MFRRTATARCARQQIQPKAGRDAQTRGSCRRPRVHFTNSRFQPIASHTARPSTGKHAEVSDPAGGAFAFVTGYRWYHFSGANTLVNTSKATQAYAEQAKQKIAQSII